MFDLTCDKAEKIVNRYDKRAAGSAKVLMTGYSKDLDMYFAKWISGMEERNFEDKKADLDNPEQAKEVYDFAPSPYLTAIFFNEDPGGGDPEPTVEPLEKEDVKRYAKHGLKIQVVDKRV